MMLPMDDAPTTLPDSRLSTFGQTYVGMVGLLAAISTVADSHVWYVALVLACLPLSLIALWVGFYAGIAVTFAAGHLPGDLAWLADVVWVAVWATTAWVNARLGEKVVRRGWDALRVGPSTPATDD